VDSAAVHVERWTKKPDGTWSLRETDALDEIVQLESIGAALPVSKFYFKIEL
jgi:hypothetical protein